MFRFLIRTARCANIDPRSLCRSVGGIGESAALLWVVMITSAENRPWPEDVSIGAGYRDAGLPAPSVIRPCKIVAIEAVQAERLGRLETARMTEVEEVIRRYLAIPPP